MTQGHLALEEVGGRLTVGLLQVYDLFGELNDLFRLMHQTLKESDADIHPLSSKGFLLPKSRKTKPADRFMKTDMGLLAEIGNDDADDEDEEDGVDADEPDEEGAEAVEGYKTLIAITPERRFLGVRAILIDPKDGALEPTVVAGIFGSLTLTPRENGKVASTMQSRFDLRRAALKRLVKRLGPGLAGRTDSYKVKQGKLAWTIAAQRSQPLASFGAKADVDRFVERIVEMVAEGVVVDSRVNQL